MFLDSQLLFWGTTAGAFQSLVGVTAGSSALVSTVIDLSVARDMGIGDGEAIPKSAVYVGTAITTASTSATLNIQFQGSTDSTNWTTIIETGTNSTATAIAGAKLFAIDWPHRAGGEALPRYVRQKIVYSEATATLSAGTIFSAVMIQRDDNPIGLYPSGFSVAS